MHNEEYFGGRIRLFIYAEGTALSRPVVVVSGMAAGVPHQAGATWAVLQYLLGLRELGFRAVLVEPVDIADPASSPSAAYCNAVMRRFDLEHDWCLLHEDSGRTAGMSLAEVRRTADEADVLLNISGMLRREDVVSRIPVRTFVDLDPVFVQLWHDDGIDMGYDGHTDFVSLSDIVGCAGSVIPDAGREWVSTLPPVVLDHWPVSRLRTDHVLTTVANWRGYGSVERNGVVYGQKVHSWRPLKELPSKIPVGIRLATQIHHDEPDRDRLVKEGWTLEDSTKVADSPKAYERFIAESWAEFGLAKHGYVASNSGWFSDRSACYLACGRPVLAQSTGFERRLPTGSGLLSFVDTTSAADGVDALLGDFETHRKAAREIAETYLDSRKVLPRLLGGLHG